MGLRGRTVGPASLLLATVGLLACSGAVPTRQPAAATPAASQRTDAQSAAIVRETIDMLFCGSEPFADWCQYLVILNGQPDVTITGTSLFLGVRPFTPAPLAMTLCRALAGASFDADARPVGYRHVHVFAGGSELADCDVPER